MLTLTLNGNNIPLSTDFSMQLTWKSPACAFDKIPGSFGLGITFPINEYTRTLFGFPERFAKYRTGSNQKFPGFEIRFGGVLLMAGTLTITHASANNYEASLIDQVGVLGEIEQQRDLLDIPKFAREIEWVQSANYNPDDHPYCCFPIVNHGFFKDKGLIIKRETTVPDWDRPGKTKTEVYDDQVMSYLFNKTTGRTINKLDNGSVMREFSQINLAVVTQKNNTYDVGKVTVVSPFFFLNYVIRESLKDNHFHIGSNFLDEDPQLRNLCIYNNYDTTITNYLQTGELIYQPQILGNDENGTIILLDQPYSVGVKLFSYTRGYSGFRLDENNIPVPGSYVTPKNHLPKMKVGDLILSTQNLTNVCFHFLPDNTVNILSREKILTDPAIDLDKYFLGVWEIGEQKNVALKFTREHDSNDLIFSERFNDLSDRKADIKEPVADWTEILAITNPSEGEIRLMSSNNTFYEYRWITQEKVDGQTLGSDTTDVLGWEEISIGLQNGWYEFGRTEVEEIKSSWSTCYGNEQLTLVNQQGNMNTWKAKTQAFSPRLLINNPNNTGGTQNAVFSFEYEKPNTGILPLYWKNWNEFWSNRLAVSGEFDLPVSVLRHLIYNICSKYRTREGEFLIEEMSCELFINRIGTTQIKGYKV
ncbi:MAG: hypothetical protein WAO52_02435 [Prolixibacteraceae bacterium]